MNWREIQKKAIAAFNKENRTKASIKKDVKVGSVTHEFDLFEKGKLAGGVTTGKWKTSGGKSNTGAKDHATAELLWLDLIKTVKRKVLILTDHYMVDGLFNRFRNAGFSKQIEIWHFDPRSGRISHKRNLK